VFWAGKGRVGGVCVGGREGLGRRSVCYCITV
jgi:hypothetical protein